VKTLFILKDKIDIDHQISLKGGPEKATLNNTWDACAYATCDYLLREEGFMGITPDRSFLDDPKTY
jgi:hypothetical protein